MTCTACGFANPHGMKFCGKCGEPLQVHTICIACGRENPPGFKFCGECGASLGGRDPRQTVGGAAEGSAGASPSQRSPRSYTPKHLAEKILTSRSVLEGERKQVTVLFADVKGSMDLSEQVDPEDWHRINEGNGAHGASIFATSVTDGDVGVSFQPARRR
jgi:predicted nucleic acid-binding Zn ribbon protein